MFESKYSKVLTIILVIVIVAILGLLGFLGYDLYQRYFLENDAMAFVEDYEQDVDDNDQNVEEPKEEENVAGDAENPIGDINSTNTNTNNSSSSTKDKPKYKGYDVLGTLKIPVINFEYPILENPGAIETSVAMLYGVGINQVGNTVIYGHNYRNGLFFSNLKKVNNGDKLYVTDNDGNRLTYTVYNKFEATPNDTSFYQRDTLGKPEVTLSTCTDDSKARTIIFARAD